MSVADLRSRYAEVFRETTNARHRDWLVKRVIWRMQALAEGDISQRAKHCRPRGDVPTSTSERSRVDSGSHSPIPRRTGIDRQSTGCKSSVRISCIGVSSCRGSSVNGRKPNRK
jgi:hypothetical protein